jgi:hypothetical protein
MLRRARPALEAKAADLARPSAREPGLRRDAARRGLAQVWSPGDNAVGRPSPGVSAGRKVSHFVGGKVSHVDVGYSA